MSGIFIHMLRWYHKRVGSETAQTLVEYGLLLALIATVVIVALLFLGPIISELFANDIANTIQNP